MHAMHSPHPSALILSPPWTLPASRSVSATAIEQGITDENRHIEVTWRWRGSVRGVVRLRDVDDLVVGTAPDCGLCVPLPMASRFTLLTKTKAGRWHVRLAPGMVATLHGADDVMVLDDGRTVSDGDARSVAIGDDERIVIDLGDHRLEVGVVARSRGVVVAAAFDGLWAHTALLTSFLMIVPLATALFLPAPLDDLDVELFTSPGRFSTLILKPPPRDSAFLARVKLPPTKAPSSSSGQASAAGRREPVSQAGRAASPAKAPSDVEVVNGRMADLFGAAGIGAVFANDTSGGALHTALGGLDGRQVASTAGLGGLGFRVMGTGHAGAGTGTLGTGRIGTRGKSNGDDGYGEATGGFIAKADREPTVVIDAGTVTGSLDPELIRQVVRSHAGQIRYCYERELTTTPGLGGKIVMKWVIAGNGAVMSASAVDNQMKNSAVAACLVSRVQGWTFPLPRGGGVVVVTYPFVFKQAG